MYQNNELVIRPIEQKDLYKLWTLIYKDDAPEWKKWDAPYFPHESMSYDKFMANAESLVDQASRWVITVDDIVCGMISYYFEDAQKIWLEMEIGRASSRKKGGSGRTISSIDKINKER